MSESECMVISSRDSYNSRRRAFVVEQGWKFSGFRLVNQRLPEEPQKHIISEQSIGHASPLRTVLRILGLSSDRLTAFVGRGRIGRSSPLTSPEQHRD